jgi:hypothetical protein
MFGFNYWVARSAQDLKVGLVVGASLDQGEDVMHGQIIG